MTITTVAALGEAEAKYNQVTFSVHLSEIALQVPTAKRKLAVLIEQLENSMLDLKNELGVKIVKNSVRSSSRVDEKQEWKKDKHEFIGYEITYSYYFDVDDLDKVNQIYDALTSLPKARVQAPVFSLKNKDRLNKKALKNAWKKVTERFEMECQMLGLDPANFEVSSWETGYSDSRRSDRVKGPTGPTGPTGPQGSPGAARALAASGGDDVVESAAMGGSDPSIGFTVGLAAVTVNLEVGYQRKQ